MVTVKVNGLDKLRDNLAKFPKEISKNLGQAGKESAESVVFPTEGLKKYPPATAANQPPTPYYVRGVGTQTLTRNYGNSERYGTSFYSRNEDTRTYIGNNASYAAYLTDEQLQARAMGAKGWKKLVDVVNEKIEAIKSVYQNWVGKTIKDLNL